MVGRIVLFLLLAVVAQAQGATEAHGAVVKGTVILNGEGGPGVANVQITDSTHAGGPWATDTDGGFTLDYPNRAPGEKVRLGVIKEGYVVVNWVQLELDLPKDPNAYPLEIIICKEADREEMARRFYQLKGVEAIEATYQQKLKSLEELNKSDAATIAKLQEERDQAIHGKAGVVPTPLGLPQEVANRQTQPMVFAKEKAIGARQQPTPSQSYRKPGSRRRAECREASTAS